MKRLILLNVATLLNAIGLCLATATPSYYSSTQELSRVLRMEEEFVVKLKEHKAQLEASVKAIRKYEDQVRDMYEREDCWPMTKENCPEDKLVDRIVGNPIYNYQVLKRLLVDFVRVEKTVKSIDAKKTLGDLRKIRNRFGGLPSEADLQGAARALNRLQEVYVLNVTEFASGRIGDFVTGAELNVKDTFYLGRFALLNNKPELALQWLEAAALQAIADPSVKPSQIQSMIRQVERKLPPGFKESQLEILNALNGEIEDEDPLEYKLYKTPMRSSDPEKWTTDTDRINYRALCKGKTLLPVKERSRLMCYRTDLGVAYFKVGPVKMEIAHDEPHKVVIFHGIFHDKEMDVAIDKAVPKFEKATVGVDKTQSDMRVSANAWLDTDIKEVEKMSRRIDLLTGLRTTKSLDPHKEAKEDQYELFQVANYGIGGHYSMHHDAKFLYKESVDLVRSDKNIIIGDRMSTFMIYLSDVIMGGNTAFPRLGISVKPERGSAVFWHNIKKSGASDMTMLHGGCPVVLGSKWIANKWIQETANILTRPCSSEGVHV